MAADPEAWRCRHSARRPCCRGRGRLRDGEYTSSQPPAGQGSRHGWLCDSAHLGIGRVSYALRLQEPATVLMCRCGRSHRYPLCDGSHGAPARKPWWRPWG
ncbi:MAG: CDGSH iron-sulfur domain-containing protein [Vulcanococcus sp.]